MEVNRRTGPSSLVPASGHWRSSKDPRVSRAPTCSRRSPRGCGKTRSLLPHLCHGPRLQDGTNVSLRSVSGDFEIFYN